MQSRSPAPADSRRATIGYVAPFVVFVGIMALEKAVQLPSVSLYPVRFCVVLAVLLWYSRPYLSLRPSSPAMSVLLGIAVFAIWVGPDVLFGPGYRAHWLFQNAITGSASSSIPAEMKSAFWFAALRATSSTLLVPMVEELFWRGWLMRWIVNRDFLSVPLGAYAPGAFWMVAFLFASEHGPYWEVGLATGALFNWWMVRTRNLADCILAHAVTNGLLSAYVLSTGQWQYWL